MKILCVFGRHNYGDPKRGESYEFSNFVPTLSRLGYDVRFFESHNRSSYESYQELNRGLLRAVEETSPDLIFAVPLLYEIWTETWRILNEWGRTTLLLWTTDDSWKYRQSTRFLAGEFHAVTTTYPAILASYERDGIRHVMLTQWAANSADLRAPLPSSECRHQVSFIGTANHDREHMIEHLRKRRIPVECFGYGWPNGPIDHSDIPKIIRNSRISLNFTKSVRSFLGTSVQDARQIKARTFEVPGAGGFLLTERANGLEKIYEVGKEIEAFDDPKELREKIEHYLNRPSDRDRIANCGYERTKRDHTYEQRLSSVIEFARSQHPQRILRSGVPRALDWERFERTERTFGLGMWGKALRSIILFVCRAIWGGARSIKAARRIVFEISWRINGPRTYSSRSLPARMFYRE